jgi:hypothetical protein
MLAAAPVLEKVAKERQRASGGDKVSADARALQGKSPEPVKPNPQVRDQLAAMLPRRGLDAQRAGAPGC